MMLSYQRIRFGIHLVCTIVLLVDLSMRYSSASGEESLNEPVYRIAREASATEHPVSPTVFPAGQGQAPLPFNLTQREGEHPLMPMIRLAKSSLSEMDQHIHDYSCTLVKRERIDGELGEYQHIFLKVRQRPFSVYMSFLKPYPGREVLYVAGQNEGKMLVLESGWKRKMLGKLQLDPEGMIAMRGQKYPISNIGLRHLLEELLARAEADTQFGECEVTTKTNTKIDGRPTTLIQIVHPVPRQNFSSHICRIFMDNQLRVPIHYDSFLWPTEPGQDPPLEESYTYRNLKINNGFTARDFDTDNPEIFVP